MAAREARIRSTRIAVDSCNTFLISSIRQTQKLRIPNLGFCIASYALSYSRGIDVYGYGTTYPSDNYIIRGNIILNPTARGMVIDGGISDGTMSLKVLDNFIDSAEQYIIGGNLTNNKVKLQHKLMWNMTRPSELSTSATLENTINYINALRDNRINSGVMV